MRLFRLCKTVDSATVLSGEGGLVVDGRWHRQGRRIVYCASSEALAVLEVRVHLGRVVPAGGFTMHELELPDDAVETPPAEQLPPDWAAVPPTAASQRCGSDWLASARSLALRVPSVHSATDFSVLVNPAHPEIGAVRVLARRE